MIIIGERINTGFKDIKEAVMAHDPKPLQEWARKQAAAGCDYIDVNLGAVSSKGSDMAWMIEQVQAVVDTPISIDTNKEAILAEAIKACKKPPLVNSTTAAQAKMDAFFPIVADYHASIIGLPIDEAGTPKNAEKRVELAALLLAKAMECGVPTDHVFLDPIVMPLKFLQDQAKVVLETARQYPLLADPAPHIVCGLSNISNKTLHKKLIDRTYLAMLIGAGLDAVIADAMDVELRQTILTAELLMNRQIYADSYIPA
jgi:5-methyltetrahydrofolate corrinoid/iron sulfur protein methyltransferase